MNYLALTIFVIMVGAFIFERVRHDKAMARKDEMLAAKSYQEFKYYQGLYQDERAELKRQRDDLRKVQSETYEEVDITQEKAKTADEVRREAFDEDWGDGEIDTDKLKKIMETK